MICSTLSSCLLYSWILFTWTSNREAGFTTTPCVSFRYSANFTLFSCKIRLHKSVDGELKKKTDLLDLWYPLLEGGRARERIKLLQQEQILHPTFSSNILYYSIPKWTLSTCTIEQGPLLGQANWYYRQIVHIYCIYACKVNELEWSTCTCTL